MPSTRARVREGAGNRRQPKRRPLGKFTRQKRPADTQGAMPLRGMRRVVSGEQRDVVVDGALPAVSGQVTRVLAYGV
jgi:hypothetical protein